MELTKTKFKKTEVGLIPEDWKCLPLVDCVDYIHGKAHEQYIVEFGKYVVVNSKFISSDGNVRKHSNASFCTAKVGDVLTVLSDLPNGKALAKCFLVDEGDKYAVNQRVCIWRAKSISESKFLYYVLNRNKYFLSLNDGVSQTHILNHHIEKCKIPLPPTLNEQKAIATALSDVDEMIAKLEKLIEKKKAIKQGAMQQLLTPKENWVKKRISDIAEVGRGRVISHKEIESSIDNSYPVYSSQTSNNGVMGCIGTYDFEGEYVTWTTDGVNAGTVFFRNGKFNCTNVCGTLKLKIDNPKFIAICLNNVTSKYVSRNLANPKLMNDVMKKIEIIIPLDIAEQNLIAEKMDFLESNILLLERKLTKLFSIKQGMMQELLTGRTRLI